MKTEQKPGNDEGQPLNRAQGLVGNTEGELRRETRKTPVITKARGTRAKTLTRSGTAAVAPERKRRNRAAVRQEKHLSRESGAYLKGERGTEPASERGGDASLNTT